MNWIIKHSLKCDIRMYNQSEQEVHYCLFSLVLEEKAMGANGIYTIESLSLSLVYKSEVNDAMICNYLSDE